jgi:hypothetical protein
MAVRDGEKPLFSFEKAEDHLMNCENCHQEIEQLENTLNLFKNQARPDAVIDLWSGIENQLKEKTVTAKQRWQPFILLGAILIMYKLLEMIPERDLGFLFKLVPLVFVVALFLLLKENPFKINTELKHER